MQLKSATLTVSPITPITYLLSIYILYLVSLKEHRDIVFNKHQTCMRGKSEVLHKNVLNTISRTITQQEKELDMMT